MKAIAIINGESKLASTGTHSPTAFGGIRYIAQGLRDSAVQ